MSVSDAGPEALNSEEVSDESRPLFRSTHVSVRFGGVHAVDSVTLTAARGKISSIVGPNGAGKTTFLNAISGLVRPAGGELWMGDVALHELPARARARVGVGRTFQHPVLIEDRTVAENVSLGLQVDGRLRLISTLGVVAATRREREVRERALGVCCAVGIDAHHDRPIAGLPYGTKKLVDLARALASEPALLLLDEPFAGLTSDEKIEMERVVRAVGEGVAVVMIEHDLDVVRRMSDVVNVFNFGQLLATGTYDEVITKPDVVAAYFGTRHAQGMEHAP